jgi:hypothetical protein
MPIMPDAAALATGGKSASIATEKPAWQAEEEVSKVPPRL